MTLCIWVDCDDVLAETMQQAIKLSPFKEKWTKLSDIKSLSSPKILEELETSPNELFKLFYSFFESEDYWLTQPVSGAYEKLYERKKQWHKLFVVTWRAKPFEKETKEWIENHYPNIFTDYLFMNQHTENEIPKSQLCKEKWIQLLIDDIETNIFDINSVWIPWFLLDKPRNQWVEDSNLLKRVYSRDEINLNTFF